MKYLYINYYFNCHISLPVGLITWNSKDKYDIHISIPALPTLDRENEKIGTLVSLFLDNIKKWEKEGLPGYQFGLGRQVCSKPYETLFWANAKALLNNSIQLSDIFEYPEDISAKDLLETLETPRSKNDIPYLV